MKLKRMYQEIIARGRKADVRSQAEIEALLKKQQELHEKQSEKEKASFDADRLFNPYADTRILCGLPQSEIKSVIVGIDVEAGELLVVERLKEKGAAIDLAVAHHPEGYAYARFYEVMDLQTDIFASEGISLSVSQNLLQERQQQVARRVHAANHTRSVDIARLLGLNFLCMHTPCDNCAYQFLKDSLRTAKPTSLAEIMNMLEDIPEYLV